MYDEESKAIQETAKATQEVSKTVSNGIDKISKASKFLVTVFGKPISDIAEIAGGYTEYWKINNAIKLNEKLMATLEEKNLKIENPLPLRIGIPLIDAALNEDETNLQDIWANLLASSMSNKTTLGVTKTYIEIVKNLDSLDAEFLNNIFGMHLSTAFKDRSYWKNNAGHDFLKSTRALLNIERLGLIEILKEEKEKELDHDENILTIIFTDEKKVEPTFTVHLKVTVFGFYFMKECTNKKLMSNDGQELVAIDERIKLNTEKKETVQE